MADKIAAGKMPPEAGADLPVMFDMFAPTADTLRKFNEEMFQFMAGRLRAQASFVERLAQCREPTDILRHQTDFLQTAWRAYLDETSQLWGANGGPRH